MHLHEAIAPPTEGVPFSIRMRLFSRPAVPSHRRMLWTRDVDGRLWRPFCEQETCELLKLPHPIGGRFAFDLVVQFGDFAVTRQQRRLEACLTSNRVSNRFEIHLHEGWETRVLLNETDLMLQEIFQLEQNSVRAFPFIAWFERFKRIDEEDRDFEVRDWNARIREKGVRPRWYVTAGDGTCWVPYQSSDVMIDESEDPAAATLALFYKNAANGSWLY